MVVRSSHPSLILALVSLTMAWAEAAPLQLPRGSISRSDPVFLQLLDSIEQAVQNPDGPHSPYFALIRAPENSTIFSLAAGLSLPYGTIATLNDLPGPHFFRPGEYYLIPSVPGLFRPLVPKTGVIYPSDDESEGTDLSFSYANDGNGSGPVEVRGSFFTMASYDSSQRTRFLSTRFIHPLSRIRLTSDFGWRTQPISGTLSFHNGIDLASPGGSNIYAVYEGTVITSQWDDVFGWYVVVDHGTGLKTLYGHMEARGLAVGTDVEQGDVVGKVGLTGQTTGYHLHFEVRGIRGPVNPWEYLPRS